MSLINNHSYFDVPQCEESATVDSINHSNMTRYRSSTKSFDARQILIDNVDQQSSVSSHCSSSSSNNTMVQEEPHSMSSKGISSRHKTSLVKIDTRFSTIHRQSPLHLVSVRSNSAEPRSLNHCHHFKTFDTTPCLVINSVTDQSGDNTEEYILSDIDIDNLADKKMFINQNQPYSMVCQSPDQYVDEMVSRLDISDVNSNPTPVGLTLDTTVIRSPVNRSSSVISSSSSRGNSRLPKRLSYLEHVEHLEAEEAKIAEEKTCQVKPSTEGMINSNSAMVMECLVPRNVPTINEDKRAINTKGLQPVGFTPVYPGRRSSLPHFNAYSHTPAVVPIPNLYKRLLRIFKSPSEVSDSDTGPVDAPSSTTKPHRVRGQFGFPAGFEGGRRGSSKSCSSKLKSLDKMSAVAVPPSSSTAGVTTRQVIEANPQIHRPPESSGLRARFFKMISSPNLHGVVYPMGASKWRSFDQQNNPDYSNECSEREAPLSPNSPIPSDFEHESSCPAGQRIQERRNESDKAFVPRKPTRMPTLQSKYGVPTRELGAGTQAQVMLLRVRSSRRSKSYDIRSRQPPRTPHSAEDGNSSNSLLSPRSLTGTVMTTTEDEVTPEQREVYRKKLLRRASTAGASITDGGLIYAIKKFRPPKATETHRQYLKKVCAEFCISTSMDHENIIRAIDLVRNQPGQDLHDDEVQFKNDHSNISRSIHQNMLTVPTDGQGPKDDCRDCSCYNERSRRVRGVKSADDLFSSSPTSPKDRSIHRRSVISKPQRKRSIDNLSYRRSIISGYDQSVSPRDLQHRSEQNLYQTAAQLAASKKLKQKQEQEIRQRELQRLKQQKQKEKQQAKQFQLDQFPEYCMVMEFAAGGDLFNLLTTSYPPISLNEKYCLWRQLISGVQYMHSMGVAHRDLKPENILIDGSGRILKITDFGIANVFKSVGDPIPLPCSGIIGSEPYIAPEEFYKDEYDPRAVDVWACGIILYVMYYSAMPWARADRKKDARFARYINDIMAHRHGEPQRRLQYERQRDRKNSATSLLDGLQQRRIELAYPYPPIESLNECGSPSSGAGSPCNSHGNSGVEGSDSSANSSPVSPKGTSPLGKMEQSTAAVYNTYSYNGHIGGHEFLDKMELPGCRKIIYAILEPDAKKRLTIDQVANDDWVIKIRYCTDCDEKKEHQAALVFGKGADLSRYMDNDNGEPHHKHATPKKVKN